MIKAAVIAVAAEHFCSNPGCDKPFEAYITVLNILTLTSSQANLGKMAAIRAVLYPLGLWVLYYLGPCSPCHPQQWKDVKSEQSLVYQIDCRWFRLSQAGGWPAHHRGLSPGHTRKKKKKKSSSRRVKERSGWQGRARHVLVGDCIRDANTAATSSRGAASHDQRKN